MVREGIWCNDRVSGWGREGFGTRGRVIGGVGSVGNEWRGENLKCPDCGG